MDNPSEHILLKIKNASRSALFYILLFSCFINILMLTVPLYMLQIFDRVIPSQRYETLLYLTLIAIFVLVIFALLYIARSVIMLNISNWVENALSPQALFKVPDEIIKGNPYGAQALRDIAFIKNFISSESTFALFDSPWIPIYILVIFLLHPYLGFLSVAGAIILFILAVLNDVITRSPVQKANTETIQSQQYIDSSVRNAEVIQAMGMFSGIMLQWKRYNQSAQISLTQANQWSTLITSITKFCRLALQIMMLGLGAYLVITNQLTSGGMIAGSILLSRALAPIEISISAWKQFVSAKQTYQRLYKHFSQVSRPVIDIDLPSPTGKLDIENVTYVPPGSKKPIIYQNKLSLKAGESLAIIGPTGAGKSTLARLILGAIKPNFGHVRLDGADVYTWDREIFGQYVGYLPQDVELFSGTIKENIARLGEIDDEAVIEAAKMAGVHELILKFPNSYDTFIGPNGANLSGGQRQRVALARAFYKNPVLVVLDEPNASLDNEGEEALIQALLNLKKKKTTLIIITHKPSITQHIDKILVLREGVIQMMGPRDEVFHQLKTGLEDKSA